MLELKVKNLTFKYKNSTDEDRTVIENINFTANSGDTLGIIGENGTGKSTLVRIISGLLKPTSGEVLLNNLDVFKYLKSKKTNRFKVGVVFQRPEDQLFAETVYKDIAFALNNMNLKENEIKNRVLDAAKFVNLDEKKLFVSPLALSGGERRKATIAGIIAMEPKVLILDEPTTGLDSIASEIFLNNINKYKKEHNTIVILVTHSLEDVLQHTNKVLILENNKKSNFCSTKELFLHENLEKLKLYLPGPAKVLLALKNNGYAVKLPQNKDLINNDSLVNSTLDLFKAKSII